jgi:hypothetical protein
MDSSCRFGRAGAILSLPRGRRKCPDTKKPPSVEGGFDQSIVSDGVGADGTGPPPAYMKDGISGASTWVT